MSSVTCLVVDSSPAPSALESLARACSPRVEMHGQDAAIIDTQGLSRVCGPPDVVAREIAQLAAARSLRIRLATAGSCTAAWLLAHAHEGITLVPERGDAAVLAGLPMRWLGVIIDLDHPAGSPASAECETTSAPARATAIGVPAPAPAAFLRGRVATGTCHYRLAPSPAAVTPRVARRQTPRGSTANERRQIADAYGECFATFERWGLRTLGDLAALPRQDLHARMGAIGVRLHQAACGEDVRPLVPAIEARPFADRLELEWPIEGLEPLSFVLSRQFERLCTSLDLADRGAVTVITRLTLVTKATHERTLHLPAPLKDAKVLRTLVLLDLESHPPSAGIDAVEIVLEVTPGPILQGSLLAATLPSNEDVATLVARLGALMGETRIGSPALVDTFDARAVGMGPFRLTALGVGLTGRSASGVGLTGRSASGVGLTEETPLRTALRRLRIPLPARVTVERGVPVRVIPSASGLAAGAVVASAGPWRTSGAWWTFDRDAWDRDEWDVALAPGGVYRLVRHRASRQWEIEGIFD